MKSRTFRLFKTGFSKSIGHVVVNVIPTKLFLEVGDRGGVVDEQTFHARHVRERLQMFRSEGAAEGSVMRAAGQDPRGGRDLQVRIGNPDSAGDREFGKVVFGWDQGHLVDDQAKTISQIDYGSIHSLSARGREYEADGIGFSSDRQRMNFRRGLLLGDGGAHLEHVCAEDLSGALEVIGIVLHE